MVLHHRGGGRQPRLELNDSFVDNLVTRGRADGSLDASLPSTWVNMMVWSLLYTARAQQHMPGITRAEVRRLFLASAEKLFRA